MKTQETLNTIKEKVKALSNKCHELTDEVLVKVTGGSSGDGIPESYARKHIIDALVFGPLKRRNRQ